jgi:Xaa-Pro aminopeptidase
MISADRIRMDQKKMIEAGYDAVFCRLSVNVLALLGYWPGNHAVAAVIPAQGKPALVVAETEAQNVREETDLSLVDVVPYPLENITVLVGITDCMLQKALPEVFSRMGITQGRIGIEESFEDGASARTFGDFKFPATQTWGVLRRAFPKAVFDDATGLISSLRWVKTPAEIACIKKAVQIACMGFDAARQNVAPGMTEAELSAVIESAIIRQGTGKNGAKYSRGFSSVYAGARSATQCAHWICSSGREIAQDDIVIMELGSVTDGYWCDLTRNLCAGKPSDEALAAMDAVQEAQRKGVMWMKPGARIGDIDTACHRYFESLGYGPAHYRHNCGHGTGFNYHEGPPVHCASDVVIEEGMVLCVEPGVYFEGQFGVRAEDMFVVTKDSAVLLSYYPHHLV